MPVTKPISKGKDDPYKIEASPTKDLFITMLVKDITLKDAIGDLIDNSVDAAKKNASDVSNLSLFKIEITAKKDYFEITDNCGGLEVEDARTSAFCFGKPDDYKQGKHTIGQFGIGMKRAFFKIGNYIEVESNALKSKFKMHIDVPLWRSNKTKWDFKFDEVVEGEKTLLKNTATKIKITNLNKEAVQKFNDKQFIIELSNEIALEHLYTINKGLEISINDQALKAPEITLIYDKLTKKEIIPAYWKYDFKTGLKAEIITGISDDNGKEGGWYIFCNDRLILGPDTTEKTGWTGAGGKEMPKYHDQFYRFRGYVFFNSDDSSLLPWNTTKTGMNMDSPDFLLVRNQMIIMAKQVKKLMDDMKKEREGGNPETKQALSNRIKKANVVPVVKVLRDKASLPTVYKYPEELLSTASKTKKGTRIIFYKPDLVAKKVKSYFKVEDVNEAGEMAFDYFYENEIGE